MAEINGGDNGKVTLALVGQKLDIVINRLDKMEDQLKWYINTTDAQCHEVRIDIEKIKTRQETRDSDIEALKEKSDKWNMANSILGFFAALAAIVAAELGMRN